MYLIHGRKVFSTFNFHLTSKSINALVSTAEHTILQTQITKQKKNHDEDVNAVEVSLCGKTLARSQLKNTTIATKTRFHEKTEILIFSLF
jgi:hypothetical protein